MTYSALLRIRPFRDLWLGQAISQIGDAFYYVVFMFMVKRATGSDAMVGLVGAAEMLPYFLLSPYAGVLADRMDRRRIMLVSDVLSAAILVLFGVLVALTGKPPVWSLFVTAASLSCVRAFFLPAKSASIPALVPADAVMPANALSATTQNVMPMLALGLTAGVLAALYELSPIGFLLNSVGLNALSFLLSAFFIFRLPAITPQRADGEEAHPLEDLREGLRYIRRRREIAVLLVLQTVLSLFISPFFVAYVAVNDQWFGGKPGTLAWFEFAFFVGMVASSMVVGRLDIRRPGQGFIWGLAVTGACVAAMALSPFFWAFVVWNLAAGLSVPFAQIPISTYLQTSVPDAFRGRVNAVYSMLNVGVMPLGMALGGILIKGIGLVAMFLVMGIGMGLAALAGLLDREFREARMPDGEVSGVEEEAPKTQHLIPNA